MDLATMRARVREDLQDEDAANYRWSNDQVDGAIERVVREFSLACPAQEEDEITTTADSKELDISWLSDLLAIVSVEYLMDLTPAYYQRFNFWGGKLYMTDEGDGTKKARVRWHKWHTLKGATAWVAATAYALGDIVVPTTANGFWYECTTAGTSDGAEPTWPTTAGDTVNDNTAVWTCRTSTLPQQYEEIIVLGATGYLASSASVYTVDKATIAGRHATANFLKWGQQRLDRYQDKLKQLATVRRVITRQLYTE